MNNKKAITLLLLATMILALVPVIPVSAALDNVLVDGSYTQLVYDQEVSINGSGVTPGSTIELYWDYVQPWDGEAGKIGSASGKPSGLWEIEFDVPEAIAGDHFLWVKDVSTGETIIIDTDQAGDAFTMLPSLELSNDNGLAGEPITVYGYGFNATSDISYILFGNTTLWQNFTTGLPDSDDLGTWEDSVEIPDDWFYSAVTEDYNFTAGDEWGNTAAEVAFTIGASITLDKEEGPTGTVVKITGEGFENVDLDQGDVTFNGTACYIKDAPVTVSGGEFTMSIVIPSDDIWVDEDEITVTDGTNSPTADFEVTGLPDLEADPEFQVQGGRFTVYGTNYSRISGEDVTFYLNGTELGTVETEADGTFEANLRVPAVTSGVYVLYGEMGGDFNINASINYRVGIMLVILSEESAACGELITVTATGFTADGHWNMTIGGERPDPVTESEDCDSEGSLSQEITIPTLPVGVHTVSVYDIEAEIAVETEFEVTHTTALYADPYEVPVVLDVTLSGE